MLIIGDIHGKVDKYLELISSSDESIQIGDFGYGFSSTKNLNTIPLQHKFIRGNHDSPAICKGSLNYLGDYGYLEDKEIFFVSGGDSIDKAHRVEGVSWWRDEELSYRDMLDARILYMETKPKIVLSHEAPSCIIPLIHSHHSTFAPSKTAQCLQSMFEIHRPTKWIFGHHHISYKEIIDGTEFICLSELETCEI